MRTRDRAPYFVIVNHDGKFLGFYGWVKKYPDAQVFDNLKDAKAMWATARPTFSDIVADYGLETERKI
jgi:hypothetical protein